MVKIRIRGAWFIEVRFVAFYFDLHFGHKYLLFFVKLSTEQNSFKASPSVGSPPEACIYKGNVKVSSNVSDL